MNVLRLVRAALVVAVSLAAGARPAAAGAVRVAGERWDVESEGSEDEAREWAAVLDAAWPQFEAFFGAAPKVAKGERLRVRVFETAPAMQAAIRAAGGVVPDAGGYYCPVARTSYAFRQPSRWYTRTLILHEAAHQFHLRGAAAKAKAPPPSWWQEGLVEHVSHHTWDGRTLRLGVVPPISLEDRPAAALAAASAAGHAPERVAEQALDRPQAMHLVRWMATSNDGGPVARWRDLAKRLDGGEALAPRDLAAALGGSAALRVRYESWLRTVQQPFVSCFVEWDSTAADGVRGSAGAIAACRTRGAADSVAATVTVADPARPWRAGLLVEWTGPDAYVVAQVEGGTRYFVDRRASGAWTRLADGDLAGGLRAADGAGWDLAAVRDGDDVTFRVGGSEVARFASPPGPLGLCLEGCTADFGALRLAASQTRLR